MPDISKWNIFNDNINFNDILYKLPFSNYDYEELKEFKENKYLLSNEEKYDDLFLKNIEMKNPLKNLESGTDIINYFIKRKFNMNSLFAGCSSLRFLPNISKWNINEVTDICGLFC